MFVYWKNKEGKKEIVTCPLNKGLVLPGITRKSVIQFLKEWGENVVEKEYFMDELLEAI